MSSWESKKLGDVITLKRGYDLPTKDRVDGKVPIVSSSGITGSHNEAKVKAPGVVTGRYGTLGKVFFLSEDFWPLNTSLYVKDFKGNDERFISYFLRTLPFEDQNVAGAVPGVNRNYLHELEVDVPDPATQKRIAAQLSAFDDLIENNTRRIEILEEMARRIYREWFVHFHYPGHENDGLVDSGTELGEIPEGWEVKKLEDLCELTLGQSPKSEFYNEKGEGLPFHQGVKDFGDRYPTTTTWCSKIKRIAEEGDILFSVRAPVGRINIANTKMVIGRGLHAIRSKSDNQVFIYHQLEDKFQEEDTMGSGTIYKSVTKKDMLNLKLIDPGQEMIEKFEEKAVPIFKQIKVFTDKNEKLKETRDLLLPKLISGGIDVEEMKLAI